MPNFWKSVIWAVAMIAVAILGASGIIPPEVSKILMITMPALAFASLNGRNCFGPRNCT